MVLFAVGLRGGNAWHTIHDWIVVLTVAVKFFQVLGYNKVKNIFIIVGKYLLYIFFYNVNYSTGTQEQPF